MFTRATAAAFAIALAATNVAAAQGVNALSQQAINFQMNGEVSRPAATSPTYARPWATAPKHDSLTQQAIDFQMNGEVSRSAAAALPAGAYASTVAPKPINRQAVTVPQTRDFQDEPGR